MDEQQHKCNLFYSVFGRDLNFYRNILDPDSLKNILNDESESFYKTFNKYTGFKCITIYFSLKIIEITICFKKMEPFCGQRII